MNKTKSCSYKLSQENRIKLLVSKIKTGSQDLSRQAASLLQQLFYFKNLDFFATFLCVEEHRTSINMKY